MSLIGELTSRTPDSLIYHYTSHSGLLGIVKNKSIWATNIHYLNDLEEFALAIKMTSHQLREKSSSCTDPVEKAFLDRVGDMLTGIQKTPIYVCSFSENGDLLSQWRGYCPRGNGHSIGFNYSELSGQIEKQDFLIIPCIYDSDTQHQLVRELINSLLNDFRDSMSKSSGSYDNFPLDTVGNFFQSFNQIAPMLKHQTFSEEREWRMVSKPLLGNHPQLGFREGVSMVLPYFAFGLENEDGNIPISEVFVGPTPNRDLSIKATAMFLRRECPGEWRIRHSSIPYRAW